MTEETFNQHELTIKILSSITALTKKKDNPFFKSKYVDLPTILQEIKPILFENECYLTQQITASEKATLKTQIFHKSGTVLLEATAPIPVKDINNPQNWGSAITFMKRYSLTALLGIEEEDDDGNKATKTTKTDYVMMEVLNLFLLEKVNKCSSSDELKDIWNNNKRYFNKLEEESKKDYDKLIKKVGVLKESFIKKAGVTGVNQTQPKPPSINPDIVKAKLEGDDSLEDKKKFWEANKEAIKQLPDDESLGLTELFNKLEGGNE